MPDRVEYGAYNGKAVLPPVATIDTLRLAMTANLLAGATRVSNRIECTGMRRYRLKCIQLTGTGPSRVRAFDLGYNPDPAVAWETVVLAAAQATGVRSVYNFGEGTAILTCFMGPYVAIDLQNNGPDTATYDLELWMQG
jgi:hypothetical protein